MGQNCGEVSPGESGRLTEMTANHPASTQPRIINLPPSLLCSWYATVLPAVIFMAPWTGQTSSYKTKKNERFIIQLSPLLVENYRGWMTGRKEWCLSQTGTGWQLSRKCNIFPVLCHRGKCGGWGGSWEPCHDTINSQQYLQISTPVTARSSGQH